MSVKLRLIQLVFLAGICLIALSPITAAASQTYHERVAGVETAFVTGGCGAAGDASSFAGIASGDLFGTFSATICHTALDPAKIPAATINPGGSFALSGQSTPITGVFTGGTIVFVGAAHFGTFCYENFKVVGGLVSTSSPTPGDGFAALLTHYGVWTGTACNVQFATVAGRATITG